MATLEQERLGKGSLFEEAITARPLKE